MSPAHQVPLVVPMNVREELSAWITAGYPEEVCGLLAGRRSRERIDVEWAARARNLEEARRRDRYLLAPDDWLKAENRARKEGLEIVGIWHSHPDHPARPSVTDLESAWEGYAYLIISVTARGSEDARSWLLVDGDFEEQPLEEKT